MSKCPTPTKHKHPNAHSARRQVASLRLKDGRNAALVHIYHCKCGSWHVGGARKKFGRRR